MPRMTARQLVEELVQRHEPRLREAFLAAIDDIRNSITLRIVVERLERGDVPGAIEALRIEPEAFARLEKAIFDAYADGGQAEVGNLPLVRDPDGQRVVWRFGIRNPEAEAWLREHSTTLVTRIVDDQREAIRQHLTAGLSEGQNPRQTALSVVGRVDRSTNRRTGGIIGLTVPQEEFVRRARQQLLSGDPSMMRHYLTRGRRDKRFDRTVAKAISEERPLDAGTVNKITGRYADRLLELRGEMLAMNETQEALSKAREDAIRQQIAAGKIDARDVQVIWRHTPQENPRLHHRAMNGKSVTYGEEFELPNGTRMKYPHASDAPVGEKIGCKCTFTFKIDFFTAVERRFRARAA